MYQILEKSIGNLAKVMALIGGVVLILLIAVTCVSITGRALIPLGLNQIPGDFELVEFGVGFAIFAFLPWCQLNRGHARVDLFANNFGPVMNKTIDVVADIAMFAASLLIAWRLWLGMLDKLGYSETSFILQFPVWYAYAAGFAGAALFVLVSAFCVLRSGRVLAGVET